MFLFIIIQQVGVSALAPTIKYTDFGYFGGDTLIGYNLPSQPFQSRVLGVLVGDSVEDTIKAKYPLIARVVACESQWDNSARGKAGEIGIAQFMPSTWELFSERAGYYGDIYNQDDQLTLMVWSFQNGLSWHWTCAKLLGYVE